MYEKRHAVFLQLTHGLRKVERRQDTNLKAPRFVNVLLGRSLVLVNKVGFTVAP